MVASLIFEKEYKVTMNGSNTVTIDGHKINVNNEIPVVRYRLGEITAEKMEYIKGMMQVFKNSVHLVELHLGIGDAGQQISLLEGLKVAKFLYWHITDQDCESLNDAFVTWVPFISPVVHMVDEFIIYDDTTMLDMATYNCIVSQLRNKVYNGGQSFYGLCHSPFSCSSVACLTAVKARELQAKYCDDTSVKLPTSCHEGSNNCSCIRSLTVRGDLTGDTSVKKITSSDEKKENTGGSEVKEKKAKKKKKVIPYGALF